MLDQDAQEDFVEDLAKLQVRLKDALAGFDEMAEKAEPEIAPLVAEYTALHTKHEAALSTRLSELGHAPDDDGSFFSTIQRAVVKTRAFFDDIDDDILDQVIHGEEWLESMYDAAISSASLPEDTSLLGTQRTELTSLIDKTRKQAD